MTDPQKPSTSLPAQEVANPNLEMDQIGQVMVDSHDLKDISAVERGEGGQEWSSWEEGSGGKKCEGRADADVIQDTKVTKEEMKAEGNVIPEAETIKVAEVEEGVMERLVQDSSVNEEEDEAVTEVAEKAGEEEESEEGNTIHEADLREEDIVKQDTGLVAEQSVNKGVSVR